MPDAPGPDGSGVAELPALHVVTDDDVLARDGWADGARALLEAGRDRIALHLRGPRTSGRRLYGLASALVETAARTGATLVVNDRVDVALACGSGAVHLGRRSLSVPDARRLVGADRMVGVSCHAPDEVVRAAADGADWVFAGTTFPTPSHPGSPGVGPDGLARMAGAADALPVFAIGGIGPGRVGTVLRAGASGVAVMRGIWDAPDPARAADEYIEALTVSDREGVRRSDGTPGHEGVR